MLADFAIKQKLITPVYKDDKKGGSKGDKKLDTISEDK